MTHYELWVLFIWKISENYRHLMERWARLPSLNIAKRSGEMALTGLVYEEMARFVCCKEDLRRFLRCANPLQEVWDCCLIWKKEESLSELDRSHIRRYLERLCEEGRMPPLRAPQTPPEEKGGAPT